MGAAPIASLEVELAGLRSNKGLVRICVTAEADNFPSCTNAARAVTLSVPAGQRSVRIEGLAPGNYAVAVIHDANGNGKLDTMMGIPREGFGFSRNPAIGFGPPPFDATRVPVVQQGGNTQVKMRYLL